MHTTTFFEEEMADHVRPEELVGPLNDVEAKHAPDQLYVQGDSDLLKRPRIAIVGTRNPSPEGIRKAQTIAEFLVEKNVVVVSGLADGIDTIAHNTAIERGGRTVAVLGTPLDQYYPAKNRPLQERIAQDHLLISQFSPKSPIQRKNFPLRNRTMALLSHASVIVEAGKSSGTQHQGWEALRLGRPLFIEEGLVQDKTLVWPQKLVEYGAQPFSLDDLDVLLEVLPELLI